VKGTVALGKDKLLSQHTTSKEADQQPSRQPPCGQETGNNEDLLLISRAKAGDREAFASLVQRHGKTVLNLIHRMIRDRGIVEDLWQETFVRALENLSSYEPRVQLDGSGPSFTSWLYRIAANLTLDELRRRGRWRLLSWDMLKPRRTNEPDDEEMYDPPADTPGASSLLESREDILRVRQALDTLPPEWRMILILREFQDLPYEEIAEILSVPIGTVRSRLARAREQLRIALVRQTPRRAVA
jgi:RNA polymerase sigma-70 factor, ECF subfamily